MSEDEEPLDVTGALRPFTQEQIKEAGWIRKGRREHNLHGTPRVGQVFWVDFPRDHFHPEFEGEHPAVIVRAANTMHSACIVVPITHAAQPNNPHAFTLSKNPNKDDGNRPVWIVCDHLYTVALGRLRRMITRQGNRDPVRMSDDDLFRVSSNLQRALGTIMSFTPKPDMPPPAQPRLKGPNTLSLPTRGSIGKKPSAS